MTIHPVTVPLAPAPVNITGVRAGDRNTITITLTVAGAPLDLTGLTVTSQVRKLATDADPMIDAEVTTLDAPGGQISVRWPGDDVRTTLAGAAAWAGVWDLQVGAVGSDPLTVAAGTWTADMDVTRP